jgi:hypothetical protein
MKLVKKYIQGDFFSIHKLSIYQAQTLGSDYLNVEKDLPQFIPTEIPCSIAGLTTVRTEIQKSATRIRDRVRSEAGWFLVSVGEIKGKRTKCSIPCNFQWDLDSDPFEQGSQVQIWIPTSLLYTSDEQNYAPAWIVKKSLELARTKAKKNTFFRIPVALPDWPEPMMQAWVAEHLDQLPSEEDLANLAASRANYAKVFIEKMDAQHKREQQQHAKFEKQFEEQKQKETAAFEARWENPTHANVTILWKESFKKNGRFCSEILESHNASAVVKGGRTYLLLEDGTEIIKATHNVQIIKEMPGE